MTVTENIRVLIAEDEFLIAKETERVLRSLGCEVVGCVSRGDDAIALAETERPDIVIMDINMPGMDGLAASQILAESTGIPVIVLTAHEDPNLVSQAVANGVAAYMVKPIQPEPLNRAIAVALARNKDLIELRRLNRELQEALDEIKVLRSIIPICAQCKKVRNEEGYWERVEVYLAKYLGGNISHGLCDDCVKELYPRLARRILPAEDSADPNDSK